MFFLFDIGGTAIKTGVSYTGEDVVGISRFPTPQSFDEAMAKIKVEFDKLSQLEVPEVSTGGVRSIAANKSSMMHDFKLPEWVGKPLKEELEKITGSKVLLENDTTLSGLGEANYGAGKGFDIVAYITVSTGVNGVRILNGEIEKSSFGFEIGHSIIDFDWSFIPETKVLGEKGFGQLEAYTSGGSLSHLTNMLPENVHDKSIWEKINRSLAAGIINTALYWSPDIIVIGGGVGNSDNISLEIIGTYVKEMLIREIKFPSLVKSALDDESGLYGALAMSKKVISKG